MMNSKVLLDEVHNIFNNLNEGVIIHAHDTSIDYFNQSALKILKLTKNDLISSSAYDIKWFFVDEQNEKLSVEKFPITEVLSSKKAINDRIIGVRYISEDDTHSEQNLTWVQLNAIPHFKNNEIENVIVTFIDITQQRQLSKMTHFRTYFNTVTKLPNLLSLTEDSQIINQNNVALLQIDSFDKYREFFNEKLIDELLVSVSQTLKKYTTEQIYHVELDKFMIMFDPTQDISYIEKKLFEINDALYDEKLDLNIQITTGVALASDDIFKKAKVALSTAKKLNFFYNLYTASNNTLKEIQEEIFWSKAFSKILKENTLIPAYQPIVDNKTQHIYKYEALMRLEYQGEIYYPNIFLDIAKSFRQYKFLTIGMINKVFDFFHNKDMAFSINLNTEDLMNHDIHKILFTKINNFPNPSHITVEIVESEGIVNFKEVNRFLNRLKVYGCKVAIDDFGSGYSNFEYILKLDADYIKIDGSLIKEIDHNKDSQDIVRTIVSFAKLKNIRTIAEFVSSKEIYEKVVELGVDYSQGYYFGKPEFELKESVVKINNEQEHRSTPSYKQLIYASKVNCDLSTEAAAKLFKIAAQRNNDHEISGFVVYDGVYFLQLIEGSVENLNRLYENIISDDRHTDILLLGVDFIEERDFESWHMGFIDSDEVIKDYLYKTTKEKKFLPHQFSYSFANKFLQGISKIV